MYAESFTEQVKARLGCKAALYQIPPPVFTAMSGQVIDFDAYTCWLRVRFPVLESQLNPYGAMQGGMLAAAIDNTLGPLSMLVAPPNVTRRLTVKYSRQVTLETGEIVIEAKLVEKDGRWLRFHADARDAEGRILVKGKAGLTDARLAKILDRANARALRKLEQIGTHVVEVPPQAEEAVIKALMKMPIRMKIWICTLSAAALKTTRPRNCFKTACI